METRHILIVDDEPKVAFFLGQALERSDRSYRAHVAYSGEEALEVLGRQSADVLVTDLRMPGMDGLQLLEHVRKRSPLTRLVLMTAHGNAEIQATAYHLGACRYITKPFKLEDLIGTVRSALTETKTPGRGILTLSDEHFEALAQCLSNLRFEVGAQCILLADVMGQRLAEVGETQGLELATLLSLAGGSFATAFEMARCLKDQAVTLNYHEGDLYDVYSSNVNSELFVMLVFDKHIQRSRIGMVWMYIQRTLAQLQTLISGMKQTSSQQVLDSDFGALLNSSLEQLFSQGRQAGTVAVEERQTSSSKPANELAPVEETFNLKQALEMGLLDPAWLSGFDAAGGPGQAVEKAGPDKVAQR